MRVEIGLLLTFKEKAPEGKNPFIMALDSGTTVSQALEKIGIPDHTHKVVLLNGRYTAGDRALKNGDRVTVFPALEGG